MPLLTVTVVEAIAIGVLALLFWTVWLRAREPGTPLLGAGFALAALWYFSSDSLPYTGPFIDVPVLRASSIVIGSAVVLVTVGVVQYLGFPRGWLRAFVVALWLPSAVLIAALAVGQPVRHEVFHVGVLLSYVGAALLALRRAFERPGQNHLGLAVALLIMAALPFLLQAAGVPSEQLKYFAGIGLAAFGMIVLTISLLHRQRELGREVACRTAAETRLREANVLLESRVVERTSHLHELITGLEAVNRGVSHDLRGPLGGMSQLARLAADALSRGDPSMAHRALPAIAEQCDASVRMVCSMLDLARLGEATPRREPVQLGRIVRSAFEEVILSRPGAQRPTLRCGELPTVQADPDLLRTVFVNLLGNATKFSGQTQVPRIDVVVDVEGADVQVCVRDNGVGFSADAAEHLFEPFYRAHGAAFDGHGLGLSIVRRAIEAMGGRVWAAVAPEGGAQLCFRLTGAAQSATPELAVAHAA